MKLKNINRAIRPDAQAFDKIQIDTVPRYKTSGLSGDEWRISAKITFFRKDKMIHEESYRDVETACKFLPYIHARLIDDGKAYFAGESGICDQEGCSLPATITFQKKRDFCSCCGEGKEIAYEEKCRMFCDKHKQRGDCGLDDADRNYVEVKE